MSFDYDVIVIGGGHAGANIIAELRRQKFSGRVALISDEPYLPYDRPPLSKTGLTGSIAENKLLIFKSEFYETAGCEVFLNTTATSIDPNLKTVSTNTGKTLSFNKLVLATGGRARRLNIPGSDSPKILTLRALKDSRRLKAALVPGGRLAVIGGGYIGLEVAASARTLGVSVILFEVGDRILSRVACEQTSLFFQTLHMQNKVDIRLNAEVEGFEPAKSGLKIKAGKDSMSVDTVLMGVGLVPETTLAGGAGLSVGNGVTVNQYCQTTMPDIYAIGDNSKVPIPLIGGKSLRIESVQNAAEQAKVVAAHISGTPLSYDPLPWFWSNQYNAKLKIAGLGQGYDQIVERGSFAKQGVSHCYLKSGRLIALDAINRTADFAASQKIIRMKKTMDVSKLRDPDIRLADCVLPGHG